jgi:hypothetical protein
MILVFAHAGHWISGLLYLVPLLALVVAVGIGKLRDRRGRGQHGSGLGSSE